MGFLLCFEQLVRILRVYLRKMDGGCLDLKCGRSRRRVSDDQSLEQVGKSRSYQGGRRRRVRVIGDGGGRRCETIYVSTRYIYHQPTLPGQPADNPIAVVEEAPSVMTVEQQQAEQMKVYWRVCLGSRFSRSHPHLTEFFVVH